MKMCLYSCVRACICCVRVCALCIHLHIYFPWICLLSVQLSHPHCSLLTAHSLPCCLLFSVRQIILKVAADLQYKVPSSTQKLITKMTGAEPAKRPTAEVLAAQSLFNSEHAQLLNSLGIVLYLDCGTNIGGLWYQYWWVVVPILVDCGTNISGLFDCLIVCLFVCWIDYLII